jgi:hypothetical protein
VPIARYFVVVGSVLTVLLLIADWLLPKSPPIFSDGPKIDKTTIRIESTRKWPEKIVFDTSQPTFSPLSTEVASAEKSVEQLPDEMTDQARADTPVKFTAKPKPDARPVAAYHPHARVKRKRVRIISSTHVARTHNHNRRLTLGKAEACCWSESADRWMISRAISRKRVVRRASWVGWPFSESN